MFSTLSYNLSMKMFFSDGAYSLIWQCVCVCSFTL